MTTKTSRLSLQWLHHLPEQKQIIERTQKSVSAYTGVSFDCQLDDFVVNMFLTDDYALHSFFFHWVSKCLRPHVDVTARFFMS